MLNIMKVARKERERDRERDPRNSGIVSKIRRRRGSYHRLYIDMCVYNVHGTGCKILLPEHA